MALDLGLDAATSSASFAGLVRPCAWAARPSTAAPLASGLSHGRPYGLSVVLGSREPELRALVEAQDERDDPAAYWAVGQQMTRWIGERLDADVDRFAMVAEGFEPDGSAPFRIWHGAAWTPRSTRYRVYVSLRASSAMPPRQRLLLALDAIGGRAGYERTERALLRPAEPTILSLDLGAPDRVKVYQLHADATWPDLRPLVALSGADVEDAARFVERMSDGRPTHWLTGVTLEGDVVARVALHFGLTRRHGPPPYDAEQAATRIRGVARDLGLDATAYEVLRAHSGPHHFVSFQSWDGAPRLTTYFAPSP